MSGIIDFYNFSVFAEKWRAGSLEPLPVMVDMPPSPLNETDAFADIKLTVTRHGDYAQELLFVVLNSDPTEIYVPQTVIIPAGSDSADLRIEVVNDAEIDGTQYATLTLMRSGFADKTLTLEINDDDTLESHTIGGHISGRITSGRYKVLTDITVDENHTLEIEPGTTLCFLPHVGMVVHGSLIAEGTSTDEIVLTSSSDPPGPGDWGGILIDGFQPCVLDHVEVAFAENGIKIDPTDPYGYGNTPRAFIRNCRIHENSHCGIIVASEPSIYISPNDVQIIGNSISENNTGIYLSSRSRTTATTMIGSYNSSTVMCNNIFHNVSAGIDLYATYSRDYIATAPSEVSCEISRNLICDNGHGITASTKGPYNWMVMAPTIANNLVVNNTATGLNITKYPTMNLAARIVNNTIAATGEAGITHHENPNEGFTIVNNIVVGNRAGIQAGSTFDPNACGGCLVGYNNLFGNTGGNWLNYPAEYGDLTTTNANGTPADHAMNISTDPLFVGLDDYHIQSSSPAKDAGTFIEGVVPTDDFDGESRMLPIDIGFDEVLD
jgi:hypothetical protein